MKKLISILAGLLVAQLVLAVALNMTDRDYGAFEAKERLLGFEKQTIDRLLIEDGEGSLTLKISADRWVLPEEGDFPAAQKRIDALIEKLAGLEKGWPVATTSSASRRFKVADDKYERRVTLYSGDEVAARLFVGSSPGFRKVHLRPDDEEAVFVAEFNTWEVDVQADSWIDKALIKIDEAEIEQLAIGGELTLQRQQGDLQLVGLEAQESTNLEAVNKLAGKLGDLQIQSLLGEEEGADYQQHDPDLAVEVKLKDGRQLNYQFFQVENESHYILKRSDRDRYFEVASYQVDPLKQASREKLVVVKDPDQDAAPEIKTSQNEIE
ncbi:MAG: DUF4340 domain-containing protein [Candidatus Thiodiazotropha sp.]